VNDSRANLASASVSSHYLKGIANGSNDPEVSVTHLKWLRARVGPGGLAALIALSTACSGGGPTSTITPAPGAAGSAPASSAGAGQAKADPCASGGQQVILAARIGIGVQGRAPETWVDFEVRGRELDARRFCEALVQRELAVVYPTDTPLVARLERPCLDTAMAEPKGTPPYLLAERRPIDEVEALLHGLHEKCPSAAAGVSATERRISGYEDQASCEKAQKIILAGRNRAAEDAKAKAAEWLASTIADQEKRMTEVCAAPRSAPCVEQKEVVRLLKSRAAKVASDAQAADASSESPAPVIGGPICRPR
jgi:hypothetical protein